jgi:hypothetical protein
VRCSPGNRCPTTSHRPPWFQARQYIHPGDELRLLRANFDPLLVDWSLIDDHGLLRRLRGRQVPSTRGRFSARCWPTCCGFDHLAVDGTGCQATWLSLSAPIDSAVRTFMGAPPLVGTNQRAASSEGAPAKLTNTIWVPSGDQSNAPGATHCVNDGRKWTPWRRLKVDPCAGCHGQSSVGVGIRPRSWFLSR